MAKIFLTHTPDMLANYYGPRALAELRKLGDVRLNEMGGVLDADALAQATRGCGIVVSDRQTPGPAEFFRQAADCVAFLRVAIDIRNIDAVLTNNGEVVAEGRSDAVLGNPVTAVAWLARKVEGFGVRLKAGDIVLPGSCTRAIDAPPGSDFIADFTGLGSVHLSFE